MKRAPITGVTGPDGANPTEPLFDKRYEVRGMVAADIAALDNGGTSF